MLGSLRFEGDVWAVPEGTVVFPGETLLRVTAPLPQAQWVETFLLASLSYPTLVASKAARIVTAAAGRTPGRLRGPSRPRAARPGCSRPARPTSPVSTAPATSRRPGCLGIPASGTMAHSWVQSFDSEAEAFAAYARAFPGATTLLVDTYDTLEGVRQAAAIEPPVQAVRIDSGDLREPGPASPRRSSTSAVARPVKIIASGDLDEYEIARLVAAWAPIDGFGVGTELITSRDAPRSPWSTSSSRSTARGGSSSARARRPTRWPSRSIAGVTSQGMFRGDLVTRADETAEGEPLLVPVVRGGRLVTELPALKTIRARCADQLASLPDHLKNLDAASSYPITYSDLLEADAHRLMEQGG